jgi:hypothetical protein
MSNFRNSDLLQKLERHPLKQTLAKILDAAEAFQGDIEYLSLNTDLSPRGRDNARRAKLRAATRDLRDAKAPIAEMQKKLDAKRKAVAMPQFDPKDVVGFLRRQELRAALRTMDTGLRELTLNDPAFADAMLEQPPVLSGLFLVEDFKGTISPEIQRDRDTVAAAKQKRLAGLFGAELAEIEALQETVDSANMIFDLAQVDLKLHSGMDDRAFAEFVAPIMNRQNAHWVMEDGKTICEIRNGNAEYRLGSPDELRDGVKYPNEAAYLASRAA